jgi:hypothetical protein
MRVTIIDVENKSVFQLGKMMRRAIKRRDAATMSAVEAEIRDRPLRKAEADEREIAKRKICKT